MGTIGFYDVVLQKGCLPVLREESSVYGFDSKTAILHPKEVGCFILDHLHLQDYAEEKVYVLALNTSGHLTGVCEVSHGSVSMSLFPVREICQKALLLGAVKVVLTHNHPSGSLDPSKEDVESTKKVKKALETVGIHLDDHIIVSQEGYTSLFEQGLL